MGTDCKSAAFQLRWFESTRAHQKLQRRKDAGVFLLSETFQSISKGGFEQQRPPPYVPAAKRPLRGLFRCAACVIHPRPPKMLSVRKYAGLFVLPDHSKSRLMSFTPAGFLLHLRIFLFPLKIEEEADIQHDAHSGRSGRGQTDHGQAGVGLDAHDVSHRQRRTRRVPAP